MIHPFVADIVDVAPDGNCGYRCIGGLLGRGEHSWPTIRRELIEEIQKWYVDYTTLFGGIEGVQTIIHSLTLVGECKIENWMLLPHMGHVIASAYNIVLVSLSHKQNMTFFPLRGIPPERHHLIAIAFTNNCHWVQVFMCFNDFMLIKMIIELI